MFHVEKFQEWLTQETAGMSEEDYREALNDIVDEASAREAALPDEYPEDDEENN